MLNSAIGESAFRSGLQAYLKEFQYRNTLSSDLWAAFSKSSGVDVAAMMKTWTQVVGYPVVKVEQKNPQKLCFCQERFLVNVRRPARGDSESGGAAAFRLRPSHCALGLTSVVCFVLSLVPVVSTTRVTRRS